MRAFCTLATLYVVSTPIGNLEDLSPRAARVLREVSLIAAEDTRHTARLLRHYAIATPLLSYHEHNEQGRVAPILAHLATGDVALVSDAGTPAVSDPGSVIVAAALAAGHKVSPIPGPSSVTAAVSASGLISGPFLVLGFLPRKGAERRLLIARSAATLFPVVLFESANRLAATVSELATAWGDRPAVVLRELTKLHEEVRAGTLTSLAASYADVPPKGEVVLVVGPPEPDVEGVADADVTAVLSRLLKTGLSRSQAAREAAVITGLPRSDLYVPAGALGEREHAS